MLASTIEKTLEKIVFNKAKDRFMLRKLTRTYNYDPIQQHRLGRNPIAVKEEFLELNALGVNEPKKAVKVPIIIKKTATDTNSLETLTAYFSQSLEVKVLSDSKYKNLYLTICEGRVFLHLLDVGDTAPLALSGNNQEGTSKEFLGTPKRLTNSEASVLLESGIPLYEKVSDGEYRILV